MAALEDKELREVLEGALWQVEEAKKLELSITKAMNFINLSKEAQTYGNKRLAIGLLTKARDTLFNDLVEHCISGLTDVGDVVSKMRMERTIKEARDNFSKGRLRESYDLLLSSTKNGGECGPDEIKDKECMDGSAAELYSSALDSLQKVWLKMKQEEGRGKDMSKAQKLVREAKSSLSHGMYDRVLKLCQEVLDAIQSPQDRLKEEVEETIEDITRTLRGLFPDEPRSPKEKFFKNQIEELITQAKDRMMKDNPVEAINSSRKAKEILDRLEQESIKGDIPKMIIELRGSIDDLKKTGVDVSYEEYLLKQVEETFWKGEYIKARKIANKLQSITENAKAHVTVNDLSSRLTSLDQVLKDRIGQEGYLQAREYVDKAKLLMDESAYDMASSFLDKAGDVLKD